MIKRISILASALLLAGVFVFIWFFPVQAKASNKTPKTKAQDELITDDSTVTLVAVGDIMMGTNFPDANYLPHRDTLLLKPMWPYLSGADITFGNLEGSVLNEGGEVKKCGDPTKCYAFRQPEYFVDQLKDAGFDILSVANNHMGDFGLTGRTNTQRILEEKGFTYAGLESCPWDTITKNGVKYGFTAFAPNSHCLQITDYTTLQSIVKKLDAMCDIVIVSFHGAPKVHPKTHITRKTEIFYEEDREMYTNSPAKRLTPALMLFWATDHTLPAQLIITKAVSSLIPWAISVPMRVLT